MKDLPWIYILQYSSTSSEHWPTCCNRATLLYQRTHILWPPARESRLWPHSPWQSSETRFETFRGFVRWEGASLYFMLLWVLPIGTYRRLCNPRRRRSGSLYCRGCLCPTLVVRAQASLSPILALIFGWCLYLKNRFSVPLALDHSTATHGLLYGSARLFWSSASSIFP